MAQGVTAERRSRVKIPARSGRYRRAVPLTPGERTADLALEATLRRAAWRKAFSAVPTAEQVPKPAPTRTASSAPSLFITRADVCRKERERACDHLIVFAVDASDSMAEESEIRMRAAKGAVLALLRRAYQDRHQVALVAFGGEVARVILPPTTSISRAQHCLERLPIGGATPLADGLFQAWQIIRQQRRKHPGVRPILVLLSDGEGNVSLVKGAAVLPELLQLAAHLRQDHLASVVIDAVHDPRKAGQLRLLADHLGAAYVKLAALKSRHLLRVLRTYPT